MKLLHVSAEQFRRGLTDFLSRAGFGGEHIVVERHDAPLAVLIPYSLYTDLAQDKRESVPQAGLPDTEAQPALHDQQPGYQAAQPYGQAGLMMSRTPTQPLITIEPGKRGGKPCIRGLRITVYDVLSYLAAGMSIDEILADFPDLTQEDIYACLGYAAEREKRVLVAAA